MKKLIFMALISVFSVAASAQTAPEQRNVIKDQVVDASCGKCKLGLPGKSCELAVRIDKVAYYVDGTTMKEHGDEHGKDGFCSSIKKAKVSGTIEDGRFKATDFAIVPKQKRSKKIND